MTTECTNKPYHIKWFMPIQHGHFLNSTQIKTLIKFSKAYLQTSSRTHYNSISNKYIQMDNEITNR